MTQPIKPPPQTRQEPTPTRPPERAPRGLRVRTGLRAGTYVEEVDRGAKPIG